jgi:hypothetical protein
LLRTLSLARRLGLVARRLGPILGSRARRHRSASGRVAADAQITERLFLSTNMVRSHLGRIRDKTGACRRTDLVTDAIQAGSESVIPPT